MEFNTIDPIGHEEEPRRLFRNHRLRRGIYILPSVFTVANLLCGYYAILATLEGRVGDFDNAACAIGFAIIFDSLDGRVARAMGTNSEFGKQFDSLADIVSFGIAPAFLAYAWGVRAMAAQAAPDALHLTQLGWLIGFFYLGCCAWRLARFNIQGMAPGSNRFFVGMPTPGSGRHDRRYGALLPDSNCRCSLLRPLAAAADSARRPDVEHDPVLQLQGYSSGRDAGRLSSSF